MLLILILLTVSCSKDTPIDVSSNNNSPLVIEVKQIIHQMLIQVILHLLTQYLKDTLVLMKRLLITRVRSILLTI